MKKSWLVNAALLAAVLALGTFLYLKPAREDPAAHALSQLQPAAVGAIRLERQNDPVVVLERRGEEWQITAPLSARADSFQIERLLAVLAARSIHRLPATDLARYELERPHTRLTLDGERIDFGAVNAVTREQYVLAGGAVHVIDPRHATMVPANVGQLIAKRLLAKEEMPVRFEFGDFSVASRDGKWSVTPASTELSQDDILRWVDAWRHAAALRAEPAAGGKPLETIRVTLRDGATLVLELLQRQPEVVIARPDEKLRYHFTAEAARRLLAPPAIAQPVRPGKEERKP